MANNSVGKKIWSMANVLSDDGVGSGDYLEQITYLLFIKMADEYSKPPYNRNVGIPNGENDTYDCTWSTLISKSGSELSEHYDEVLKTLAKQPGILGEIFINSKNLISQPAMLFRLIKMIDEESWISMATDVKGDIYEDLLKKTTEDVKSGAGQYFTPRPLISAIVKCMNPEPNKTINDPCCGTGGFLLSAKSYIESNYTLDSDQKRFLKFEQFRGTELVRNTYRLCLMNLLLHNISDFTANIPIRRADSLLNDTGERYDYVLTNPPFGKRSSQTFTNEEGVQEKEDVTYNRQDFWAASSNKQLNFIQHIHTILGAHGKCAVVIPDSVLFEGGAGEIVRNKLLETTDLHTILRLPSGIFYAQGIQANVMFFDNKPASPNPQTKEVWIYDFRTDIKFTLKQNPMKESDLDDFVKCYNPANRKQRVETYSEKDLNGRWRKFTYDEIIENDKTSLDLKWIKTGEDISDISIEDIFNDIKENANIISQSVVELEELIGKVEK